jgi:hypothetical protein
VTHPTHDNGRANIPGARGLEDVHRDISLANTYRLEFIKHTMSLAAAVFVFTVTFQKEILGNRIPTLRWLVAFSWGAMVVSLLGGLGHMAGWDRYYISYRKDYQERPDEGEARRMRILVGIRVGLWAQVIGFGVGLCTMAYFVYRNLGAQP